MQLCWALLILSACGGGSASTQPSPLPTSTTAPPAAAPAPSASAPPTSVVRLADDFGGRTLFPPDNWWNQEITGAPVDPQSDAFINFVGRTRALHPDFGPPPYGIPYLGVGSAEPRSPIAFVEYGGESDRGFGSEIGYPIPDAAKTQANVIEGGVPGGGSDGDRHLIVVDRDRWILYELFAARWNAGGPRWEAGSGAVFDLSASGRRPEGWTSADAQATSRIFFGRCRPTA